MHENLMHKIQDTSFISVRWISRYDNLHTTQPGAAVKPWRLCTFLRVPYFLSTRYFHTTDSQYHSKTDSVETCSITRLRTCDARLTSTRITLRARDEYKYPPLVAWTLTLVGWSASRGWNTYKRMQCWPRELFVFREGHTKLLQ